MLWGFPCHADFKGQLRALRHQHSPMTLLRHRDDFASRIREVEDKEV